MSDTDHELSGEVSDYLGSGKGRLLSINPGGMAFEEWEESELPEPLFPGQLEPHQLRLRDDVDEVLQKLAPKYRELIREFFWERLTLEEMGRERGVTRQAVHQQLQTALRKFKKEVFRLGG